MHCIIPIVTALLGLVSSADTSFCFVHTTDTHFGDGRAQESSAEKDVALWREISRIEPRPAFIINTGDVAESGTDAEYDNYRKALADLKVRQFDAPGNHDVRWNPRGKEGFTRGVGQPLYQSWDHQGVHFVLLDSTVLLEHWGHFDAAMLKWLAKDLSAVGSDRPVILAFHHWVGRDGIQIDNESALLGVVAPYNVRLWLIGHGHSDLLWNVEGAPAVMAKGLYQGSYHLIEVTGERLRVFRRSAARPTPKELVVEVPLARQPRPVWSADLQLPAGKSSEANRTAEVTVRGQLPVGTKVDCIIEGREPLSLTHAVDAWRVAVPTSTLTAGVHSAQIRVTLPDGRVYWRALALTVERNDAPRPAWAAEVGGEVQGKLICVDGTLYVPSMGGDLVALDAATGRERWRVHTDGSVFSTPLVAEGRVVFGSTNHLVYAVEAATGHVCWKTPTEGAVLAGAAWAKGRVCAASTDRTIYGLDAATGEVRWKAHGDGMFQSQVTTDGTRFFVGGWDNYFRALDVSTGRELWKKKFGRSFYYAPAIGAPTTGAGLVFVTSNDGYLHAMIATTGDIAWEVAGPSLGYSGPLFHAGRVYNASLTDRGRVFGFDAATGAKRWETPTGSVIYDSSCIWADSPTDAGGLVFVGSVDGTFSALRADDGALRWQYRLGPGHLLCSPATDARRVYIGSLSGRVTALPLTVDQPTASRSGGDATH